MADRTCLAAFCKRIGGGEGVECHFFDQSRKHLLLDDHKCWTMTECSDIDLDTDDEIPNRALLYKDRRDFVIRQGDSGTQTG